MKKISTESLVNSLKEIHGDKYDYSKVEYTRYHDPIILICPVHGEIRPIVSNLLKGHGCKRCACKAQGKHRRDSEWSDKDVHYLINNYNTKTLGFLAEKFHKDYRTVREKIKDLGLQPNTRKNFSYQEIPGYVWTRLLRNAETRIIGVSINISDIWEKFLLQDRKCALTGWPIEFSHNRSENTASIDRIDSNLPYTKENIQIVHKDLNKFKMHHELEWFYHMCKSVYLKLRKEYETCQQSGEWEYDYWNDTKHPALFRGDKYDIMQQKKQQQDELNEILNSLHGSSE